MDAVYTRVSEFTDSVYKALNDWDVYCTRESAENNVTHSLSAKTDLRNTLRKHPMWDEENLAVVIPFSYNRGIFREGISECIDEFHNIAYNLRIEEQLERATSEASLVNDKEKLEELRRYGSDARYEIRAEAREHSSSVWSLLTDICENKGSLVPKTTEEKSNYKRRYDFNYHDGQKTTRAVRRYLVSLGLDKSNKFERVFAEFSDHWVERTESTYVILSVHPMDYILSSNGRNWDSCHRIGGSYFAGTFEYMNDTSTIVTYTLDELEGGPLHLQEKISRIMFHTDLYSAGLFGVPYPGRPSDLKIQEKIASELLPDLQLMDRYDIEQFIKDKEGDVEYVLETIFQTEYSRDRFGYYDACNSSNRIYYLLSEDAIYHQPNLNVMSGKTFCFSCGEVAYPEDTTEDGYEVLCYGCCRICESCGGGVSNYDHDSTTNAFGETVYYCDCCAIYCDNCGEGCTETAEEFYAENDEVYSGTVCPTCYEHLSDEDAIIRQRKEEEAEKDRKDWERIERTLEAI